AVGFASQTVVSNLLSGVFLYIDRPFSIGDPVMIGNNAGIVEDITIFSTRLRTFDGRLLRISNNEVFNSTIVNMMATKARRIEYRFLLSHNSDVNKAISVVKSLLEKHPLILVDPGPMVFVNESNPDGIIMTVWAWSPSRSFFPVWTGLFSTIRDELIKAGIQLAVPHRVITIRSPEGASAASPEEKHGGHS
ncbi:MAG: mechanosensitive ion channel family protein, partial [Acidilobaceae archaeon]